MPAKVGILAGTGPLPRRLVDACRAQDRGVYVITFEGDNLNVDIGDASHACVHLGKVGAILRLLKEEQCEEVTMAGSFQRPAYNQLKLDLKAARLIPKLIRAKGDDALLRLLAGVLELEGFKVVGAETLLPELQIGPGTLGSVTPSPEHEIDIVTARDLLRVLGPYDIGQAVVVRRKRVLGIEGPEGTDGLIDRCARVDGEIGRCSSEDAQARPGQPGRLAVDRFGDCAPVCGGPSFRHCCRSARRSRHGSRRLKAKGRRARLLRYGISRGTGARHAVTAHKPKIMLVAGEPSGDRLGASLMSALKRRLTDAAFVGVGGTAMAAEGLKSAVPISDLAVMGLVEVIPRITEAHGPHSQHREASSPRAPRRVGYD